MSNLRSILAEVSAYYGLRPETILARGRTNDVVFPRQAFMYAARAVTWVDGSPRYSLPQIGRFLGVDHTTVLWGVRQHTKRLAEFSPTKNKVWETSKETKCLTAKSPETVQA